MDNMLPTLADINFYDHHARQRQARELFQDWHEEQNLDFIGLRWGELSVREDEAVIVHYRLVEFVPQIGAHCGFAAAAMAASIAKQRPNVAEMIIWAHSVGLTATGGLLHVRYMQHVCDKYVNIPSTVMPFPDQDGMVRDLVSGKCFLVPYDCGFGLGAPILANGHRAHWAIIYGVVLKKPQSALPEGLERLSEPWPIYHGHPEHLQPSPYDGDAFLLAKHGAYGEPNFWKFSELRQSCMQLNEVDPNKRDSGDLPPEGFQEGLRGKVLRLDCAQDVL